MQFTSPEFAPRAVAYVFAGGIFSAGIGPEISKYTRTAMAKEYQGSYALLMCLYFGMTVIPLLVDFEYSHQHRNYRPDVTTNRGDYRLPPASCSAVTRGEDTVETDRRFPDLSSSCSPEEFSVICSDGDKSAGELSTLDNPHSLAKTSKSQDPLPNRFDIEKGRGECNGKSSGEAVTDFELPPSPVPTTTTSPPRPLQDILSQWQFMFMIICQTISYSSMGGLMVATPLAMRDKNFSFNDSTSAIQLHMIGMFLPSLITGDVVASLGKVMTMLLGSLILLAGNNTHIVVEQTNLKSYFPIIMICAGALLFYTGDSKATYMSAIAIVGLGWNFSFIPSTALLTTLYKPSEKSGVQAVNDLCVIGMLAACLASAGTIFVSVIIETCGYFM